MDVLLQNKIKWHKQKYDSAENKFNENKYNFFKILETVVANGEEIPAEIIDPKTLDEGLDFVVDYKIQEKTYEHRFEYADALREARKNKVAPYQQLRAKRKKR